MTKQKPPMFVDVRLRVALAPADEISVSNNDMLSDLNVYLKIKATDVTLQCNGTRIQIAAFSLEQVFGGLEGQLCP